MFISFPLMKNEPKKNLENPKASPHKPAHGPRDFRAFLRFNASRYNVVWRADVHKSAAILREVGWKAQEKGWLCERRGRMAFLWRPFLLVRFLLGVQKKMNKEPSVEVKSTTF